MVMSYYRNGIKARDVVEETPGTSIRHLSQQLGLSASTCNSILRKYLHLFPYLLRSVPELRLTDFVQRVQCTMVSKYSTSG